MNSKAQKELAFANFWDDRYTKQDHKADPATVGNEDYEWFRTYAKLRPFLERHLPSSSTNPRIIQLGCGTSTLTADLHKVGYRNQLSIDFSQVAIDAMKEKYQSLETNWKVMDVRRMDLENATFDIAIDKGTLDAMLHGSLWDPEDDVKANSKAYVDEVARILRPGGKWLYITYRQPHFLKPLLRRENVWNIQVETLEDGPGTFEYFGFIMTKLDT